MVRTGVRLGLDVGTVRIGVSRSDPQGLMAIPLETVKRDRRGRDLRRLVEIAREREVIEIVVGLPLHLGGAEGKSAIDATSFAQRLQRKLPDVRICLVDERLTSAQAHGKLTEAGVGGRQQRSIVDQVAAQIILEHALQFEQLTGEQPGDEVSGKQTKESGHLG